jgi:hypothetical protein
MPDEAQEALGLVEERAVQERDVGKKTRIMLQCALPSLANWEVARSHIPLGFYLYTQAKY